jgi:hypothetical protein
MMLKLAAAPFVAAAVFAGVPFAGSWATTIAGGPTALNGVWTLQITSSGSYAVDYAGQAAIAGKATVRGATVVFHDTSGPRACHGAQATGSYRWHVSGKTLRLSPLKDACIGRRFVLARAFRKAG